MSIDLTESGTAIPQSTAEQQLVTQQIENLGAAYAAAPTLPTSEEIQVSSCLPGIESNRPITLIKEVPLASGILCLVGYMDQQYLVCVGVSRTGHQWPNGYFTTDQIVDFSGNVAHGFGIEEVWTNPPVAIREHGMRF